MHGRFTSRAEIQLFYIPIERSELSYTLVFTTRTDVKDHQPLFLPNGNVEAGFDHEERRVPLQPELVERFRRHGWEKELATEVNTKNEVTKWERFLQLYCQFAIRHDNRSIEVGVKVIAPEDVRYKGKF